MPEDITKAVMVLVWLLSGVIIFGWLLMGYAVMVSFVFALVFFGAPVLVYNRIKNRKVNGAQ
ncbi:MAG: hypothetical protein QNL62_06920 [Gammaproteobacteria bacterium]|nr:hypothetical protein [Gammaproteobacteria bacterium]